MKTMLTPCLLGLLLAVAACGDASPAEPETEAAPAPEPSPTPAPTPTPVPAETPDSPAFLDLTQDGWVQDVALAPLPNGFAAVWSEVSGGLWQAYFQRVSPTGEKQGPVVRLYTAESVRGAHPSFVPAGLTHGDGFTLIMRNITAPAHLVLKFDDDGARIGQVLEVPDGFGGAALLFETTSGPLVVSDSQSGVSMVGLELGAQPAPIFTSLSNAHLVGGVQGAETALLVADNEGHHQAIMGINLRCGIVQEVLQEGFGLAPQVLRMAWNGSSYAILWSAMQNTTGQLRNMYVTELAASDAFTPHTRLLKSNAAQSWVTGDFTAAPQGWVGAWAGFGGEVNDTLTLVRAGDAVTECASGTPVVARDSNLYSVAVAADANGGLGMLWSDSWGHGHSAVQIGGPSTRLYFQKQTQLECAVQP